MAVKAHEVWPTDGRRNRSYPLKIGSSIGSSGISLCLRCVPGLRCHTPVHRTVRVGQARASLTPI
jgi:hypothetical protein